VQQLSISAPRRISRQASGGFVFRPLGARSPTLDQEALQAMTTSRTLAPAGTVQQRILLIRGERVIVDADLAHFYGVPTKRLNEQVRRNRARFPVDFMFRLTVAEKAEVVAKCDHLAPLRFSRALPQAFTEHGAIMAARLLNSPASESSKSRAPTPHEIQAG